MEYDNNHFIIASRAYSLQSPAWLRSEARSELLSSAWLMGLFWVKWALLRSTEPGYQTPKSGKWWDEVRFSHLPQSTKHTLKRWDELVSWVGQ
jgi:hypothetical protein